MPNIKFLVRPISLRSLDMQTVSLVATHIVGGLLVKSGQDRSAHCECIVLRHFTAPLSKDVSKQKSCLSYNIQYVSHTY